MERAANLILTAGSLLVGGGVLLKSFFYTVDGGQRGLIFDRFQGVKESVYGEGMHFFIPVIQSPIVAEVRLQPKTVASHTGTKDLQTVDIAIRMLHKPIEQYLPEIYKTIGLNYEEKILPSIANEVLKAVVAQYDADQLIKMREKISQEIKEGLIERAKEFKIVLEDVSITHLGFMKEYAQAIEAKQVAQQLAERQKFIVLRDEEEKNAKIILSEGESEAARLINEAVKSYGTAQIEIKKLETAKHIAETLAKSPNISWIPTGNGVSNLLNLKTF
ncbi:unnamed protein product [Paramecium primaurelia]|uniref:Prohibitin n=2 Tax=Paramecium TaxID=5884 RepID=A0A8S1XFK0_9CILI|nr:unnamed protein product [Paramecium primaurelia]CAD8199703.1 unnamed protein product [Paramecium pentaurelia]